ncbi:RNase III inhibitor [Halorhodospira abdelmalekii]|uniref:macro domain-containing protein n=1 Tax=Halorhodospira abdelmalekii TaxID=421629 RepID=UPI001903E4E0|nr:macro domain-containing protein [Halorhodospira abdelmalekii]MBK1734146.1 RNase III inhibitor [Halorhodospira abdelmalekii]
MQAQFAAVTVELEVGDIAAQHECDAVVNAANAELQPGSGVAGAIHEAAGPELAQACQPLAPLEPGQAVITDAYNLPNRHVIHCLGPVFGVDEPSDELLAACYREALRLAEEQQLASIAFPSISTGAFCYPMVQAAEVALTTIAETASQLQHIKRVRLVLPNERALQAHERALEALLEGEEEA